MPILEDVKRIAERITGLKTPSDSDLASLLRQRQPQRFQFKDDGFTPNHPHWPLILYRTPVRLSPEFDPAAILEGLFERNGWGDSWRAGIYDFLHYHSRIHEVLGVASGKVRVRFGGKNGRTLSLKAGDIAILPAGTGHQCMGGSKDFLAVGAYPPFGTYDECRPTAADHDRALKLIPKVGRPRKDPAYGAEGSLGTLWR